MTHILLDNIELGVELGETVFTATPVCERQRGEAPLKHVIKEILVAVPGES